MGFLDKLQKEAVKKQDEIYKALAKKLKTKSIEELEHLLATTDDERVMDLVEAELRRR